MAQSSRRHGSDTVDILQEIMGALADAMSAPDAQAHMQIIQALQSGIAQYIQQVRQGQRQQATQMGRPQPGQGGPPGMPGGLGGGPPPDMGGGMGAPPGAAGGAMPPQQIAPGGGAGMSGFGTPNPDELRRTLAGPAAIGGGAF